MMMSFLSSHELWTPTPEVHETLLRDKTPLHVVLSGPMGGGKSSVSQGVQEWLSPYDQATHGQNRQFSVSWTSRSARVGEVDGQHYVFGVDPSDFEAGVESGSLLEHVHHPGGWYGTPMPEADKPMFYEFEVTGLQKALANRASRAIRFRESLVAIYLAQGSCRQLLDQILNRPDGMDEQKKLARASRYPGELVYILNNRLPYAVIENKPGEQTNTLVHAIRHVAGDFSAEKLSDKDVVAKATEACDSLRDHGIEPLMNIE